MAEKKLRYDGFDLIKFICSILIIFLHINPFPEESFARFITKGIANIGVPIFFILSGFFFSLKLNNSDVAEHPKILKKYIARLLTLLAIWTVPYFFIYDLPWIIKGNIFLNLFEYLKHVLLGGSEYFLWYIVSLIFGTVYYYFLKNLKPHITFLIVLILFLIGSIGTSYTQILQDTVFEKVLCSYNNIFFTLRNGLFFGLPCIYLGTVIAQKKDKINISKSLICFLFTAIIFAIECYCLFKNHLTVKTIQASVILLSIGCVLLMLNVKINLGKYSLILRKLSFLIYVIHPLYIRIILLLLPIKGTIEYYWYVFWWMQIPVILILSIITGLILIKSSEKIRFLKKAM